MIGKHWTLDKTGMINIEIPYSEIKGKTIDWDFNPILLMGWLFLINEDDEISHIWEFQFEQT
jgi:hypothetical protein